MLIFLCRCSLYICLYINCVKVDYRANYQFMENLLSLLQLIDDEKAPLSEEPEDNSLEIASAGQEGTNEEGKMDISSDCTVSGIDQLHHSSSMNQMFEKEICDIDKSPSASNCTTLESTIPSRYYLYAKNTDKYLYLYDLSYMTIQNLFFLLYSR